MAIDMSQFDPAQAKYFKSSHWVHTEVANNRHLVTLTGIVITNFKGTGSKWHRERINLTLKFPSYFVPAEKSFKIEHWAPFVTINAVYNKNYAVNGGWAVDQFGLASARKITNAIRIWADVAVCDIDGYLYRIGYTLTVSGIISTPIPGPY